MEELKLDNSTLQANKASLEDELFTHEKNIVVILGETFNQGIRQAHLLYRGPPIAGDLSWMSFGC